MTLDADRLDRYPLDFLYRYVGFWQEMERQKWEAIAAGLAGASTRAKGRF